MVAPTAGPGLPQRSAIPFPIVSGFLWILIKIFSGLGGDLHAGLRAAGCGLGCSGVGCGGGSVSRARLFSWYLLVVLRRMMGSSAADGYFPGICLLYFDE